MSVIAPSVPERAGAAPLDDASFAALIEMLGPFERRPRLAVAVSGGPDSLALCLLADRWAQSDERVAIEPPPGRYKDGNKVLGAIPKYQRRGSEDRVAAFVARYDAEVRAMDAEVGRVLDFLRS